MKFKVGDKVKVVATDLEFKEISIGFDGTMEKLRNDVSKITKVIPSKPIGNGEIYNVYILDDGFIIPEQYIIPA